MNGAERVEVDAALLRETAEIMRLVWLGHKPGMLKVSRVMKALQTALTPAPTPPEKEPSPCPF